jgi:hypothetical protein
MMQPIVACVLKTGGDFGLDHVVRLARQVRGHSKGVCLACLTDVDNTIEMARHIDWLLKLKHGWDGWWSKLESMNLPGPCLYLDLDVTVVGDLTPLIKAAADSFDLIMARGWWGPEDPNRFNSSIMGWRVSQAYLHDLFAADPERHMREGAKANKRDSWGDQGFIMKHHRGEIEAWQTLLPGFVVSFKRGCLMGEDLSRARIVCSHGKPRPWDSDGADVWLHKKGFLVDGTVSV